MKKHLKHIVIFTTIFYILFFLSITITYSAPTDKGYMDGYSNGWLDGIDKAEEDMEKDNRKSYSKVIPSNDDIIKTYNLNKESSNYKSSFLDGFLEGFKYGYNKTYKTSDEDEEQDDEEEIKSRHDETLGYAMGEIYGYRDYYNKKSNNWSNAIPSNSNIVEIFELKKETSDYRNTFISVFKEKFSEGYEKGYRKAKFEPFENSFERGGKDGELFGELLGYIYGKKDFFLGKNSDWESNLPSKTKIISDFSLNNDSKEYLDAFLLEFEHTFEEKYNEAYRDANVNLNKQTFESGYKQGVDVGRIRGEGFAQMDLLLGQPSNVIRYKPYNYDVATEFRLHLENEKYRDGFISGYNEGISAGYLKTYQELSINNLIKKLETKTIPIIGGEIATIDNRIALKINKGTYYNDIAISIDGLSEDHGGYLPSKDKLIKASETFTIKVANQSYQFDDNKFLELSFEYYGPQNGGIYKLVNNTWVYLPSKISENRITTFITPKSLNINSGVYSVFIDKDIQNIKDIRGHWAKDEINTYARRELVGLYSDNSYRPDTFITAGQLLGLLSRVYNWNLNDIADNIKGLEELNDYHSLTDYKGVIAYGLKNGYIGLYSDNTFRVHNPITYKQLDNVMKKLTGDNNFSWSNIAYSMMDRKDTRSKSYNSMDNNVTRAEAVYMLYLLNEWKY